MQSPRWLRTALLTTLLAATGSILSGCTVGAVGDVDLRPREPASDVGRILTRLYTARGSYGQALLALEARFTRDGHGWRAKWAGFEREDLELVPRFVYDAPARRNGAPPIADLRAGALPFNANASELPEIVETFAGLRAGYFAALEELIAHFETTGDARLAFARQEHRAALDIRPYEYLTPGYVVSAGLSPRRSIPQADALYAKGVRLFDQIRYIPLVGFFAASQSEATARRALATFRELIARYPDSDKIDRAAYYMGFCSGEYLRDEESAVVFYEHAIKWNPRLDLPARFRAALMYDYRLHDRDRAIAFYNRAILEEPHHDSNARFAATRIRQITHGQPGERAMPPPPLD